MSTVKLTLKFKGGPGSGHRGHRGRPGKRGGSLPGAGGLSGKVSSEKASSNILQGIVGDEKMRKLAVALAADGVAVGAPNVSMALAEEIPGMDRLLEETIYGNMYEIDQALMEDMNSALDAIHDDYIKVVEEPGWEVDRFTMKITPEREAWERKYYGEVVGGFIKGSAYAEKTLREYARDMIKNATVSKPHEIPGKRRR